MSMTNGFIRSKLKNPSKVDNLITKISALVEKKPNAFNVDFKGQKFEGILMSDLDFSDPTKITFTYGAADYELLIADIKIVKRIRTKKYVFKTNILTDVTV